MPQNNFKNAIVALILTCLSLGSYNIYAQKVGIVLSGGGSSGLAHIGFLRALEEQEIPIDYISGTSMGALVGAMYAAGYTTQEMEALFKSDEFRLWAKGKIDDRYTHYFKQNLTDASWVRLKLDFDSLLEKNLPTNIINSTSLDFGLSELFAASSASADNNFDNLFIPFRCLASDITSKKSVVFKDGNLSTAVRASITYPFYLNPVNIDGKLLYDGGLYDNFPVSTLCEEFEPDFIVGNNVSYNFPKPQEDNVLSQIRSMMSYDTDYEINCEKGFIVEPKVPEISLLDFSNVTEMVTIGYQAALKKTDSIKRFLTVRKSVETLNEERRKYNEKKPELVIKKIEVEGLTKSETKYILKSLRANKKKDIGFHEFESTIFRLASDEKIERIDPNLTYVDSLDGFILTLKVKKEKSFFVSFGGNISNMNVNEGFIALQYNNLSVTPFTAYSNAYFGRFYTSAHVLGKIEFPSALPFQLTGAYTYNKWDYFQNSSFLIDESAPSYLIQRENFATSELTFPFSYKGKVDIGANLGRVEYEYYLDNEFTRFDTADVTTFRNTTIYAKYERNSLNRKQYANKGNYLCLKGSYVDGKENTSPGGSTSFLHDTSLNHSWYSIKAHIDQYFNANRKFKYGFMLEGVYSDQPFFSNYAATLLSSPGFEPIPESKTIFRSKFRAHQYGAVGVRTIYTPARNFDLRLEGFMFQPLKEIVLSKENTLKYEDVIQNRYFIGSFTMVYDLNLTQIALNVNYYDNFNEEFPRNKPENYTVMLHLGFIIFNESMQK